MIKPPPIEEISPAAVVDMAPLIDMTFLLLIFFLLNTHFIRETGVEVNLPKARTGNTAEAETMRIAVTASGTVHVNNRQVDLGSISALVGRMRGRYPDAGVLVIADESTRTGLLVRVIDQVRLGGVEDVSIATLQEK